MFHNPLRVHRFIAFFNRQDSLEAHLVCNIFKKWKEVVNK